MTSSPHFTSRELACPHCGKNECTQELVDALETFRALAGRPVIVDSAYRCEEHNRAVGGAPHSQHVLGLAADIRVLGMTAAQLEEIARQIPAIKGIGRGDHQSYLHIDVREAPAQWTYDAKGKQQFYYPPVSA